MERLARKKKDDGDLDKMKVIRVFRFYTYLKLEPIALVDSVWKKNTCNFLSCMSYFGLQNKLEI